MIASPLLQVKNLNTWYDESHVLFDVSMEVHAGETVTLLGRNGAGKTTTLRSIVGLVRRRTGHVSLGGQDLLSTPIHKIAPAGIGYVPEERGIFASLTVEENLLLPPQVAEDGIPLDDIYRMFPNLLERRHSAGTRLSGGEQQMLAIARVLRAGPRVLLLDEPTEGLAPVIVQRIGALLRQLKQLGYTILLVEQNFRFAARLADRFYVMENGKMVDTLSAAEVQHRRSQLNEYLGV